MKLIDLITTIAISILLSGFLACQALLALTPPHENVSSDSYSILEGRELQEFPNLSLDSFLNRSAQSSINSYCSDHIPFRNTALIANAKLQRSAIRSSAWAFGFNCYPSSYGSSVLCIDEIGAATRIPTQYSETYLNDLNSFGAGLAKVANEHPDKRFIVCMPAGDNTPDISPAFALTSKPMPATLLAEQLDNQLSNIGNVTFVTDAGSYDSLNDYFAYYYKTDHHWNIRGAAKNYNLIADALGFQCLDLSAHLVGTAPFSGSMAREGLIEINEEAIDLEQDFSDISFNSQNNEPRNGSQHPEYYSASAELQQYNFNALYYTYGDTIKGPGLGTSLLICDSFGAEIMRPLAQQYNTTHYCLDAYHTATEGSLNERIEKYNPDDIIFVANSNDLRSFKRRNPNYFN